MLDLLERKTLLRISSVDYSEAFVFVVTYSELLDDSIGTLGGRGLESHHGLLTLFLGVSACFVARSFFSLNAHVEGSELLSVAVELGVVEGHELL